MFRPLINRALRPPIVLQPRIYRASQGFRRLQSSESSESDHEIKHENVGSDKTGPDIYLKDLARLDGRVGTLEGVYEHVITRGFTELKEEMKQSRVETAKWLRWIIGFSFGTVLLKVLYYDVKVQDSMEERLQNIILNGQAKFAAEVRENQEKFMDEMRENQKKSANEIQEIREFLKALVSPRTSK